MMLFRIYVFGKSPIWFVTGKNILSDQAVFSISNVSLMDRANKALFVGYTYLQNEISDRSQRFIELVVLVNPRFSVDNFLQGTDAVEEYVPD